MFLLQGVTGDPVGDAQQIVNRLDIYDESSSCTKHSDLDESMTKRDEGSQVKMHYQGFLP